jgi:excisionase family DNA binding protein
MTIEENAIYTPAEVAGLLRCSRSNVYSLIKGGDLAVIRVGAGTSGMRVAGSDITVFLESRKEGGPSPQSSFKHLGKFLN